ncbi:hypothetical protein [Ethanoligenens sp.]|uniref:hypothetical protein n=1 Tax=Ethanoligenens sp. TaxID=2099655 RepID=UPI0039EB7857
MKAITIWQPWASLLACGAKKYETRGRVTRYRGPIAIHAAVKKLPKQADMPLETFDAITTALAEHYGYWRSGWHLKRTKMNLDGSDNGFDIPRGAIVAVGELIACRPIVAVGWTGTLEHRIAWVDEHLCPHYPTAQEILFGDWTPGRYAWEIANAQMLPEPISAKGMQGLWNWSGISKDIGHVDGI